MSYVPVEKVCGVIKNKFEAVVVAAREARHINTIMRMVGRDDAKAKVTTRALNRVIRGDVDYVYLDEQTMRAQPQEAQRNESEPAV
jgi:DNA-directed RNA polymerase subunit K/omega